MENALKRYLLRNGEEGYGKAIIALAKKTGITENSVRNIARYTQKEIDRMYHSTFRSLLRVGINMDNWNFEPVAGEEEEVIN